MNANDKTAEVIGKLQEAESDLDRIREQMAGPGFPDSLEQLQERVNFWAAYHGVLFATLAAVRFADELRMGSLMRRLLPVLQCVTRLIQTTRMAASPMTPGPAILCQFLRECDNLGRSVRSLQFAPTGPRIRSPLQLQKEMNSPTDPPDRWLQQIVAQWNHLPGSTLRISRILFGDEPDLTPEEIAQHPELIAWRQREAALPDYDDSLLAGECKSIERARERAAAALETAGV